MKREVLVQSLLIAAVLGVDTAVGLWNEVNKYFRALTHPAVVKSRDFAGEEFEPIHRYDDDDEGDDEQVVPWPILGSPLGEIVLPRVARRVLRVRQLVARNSRAELSARRARGPSELSTSTAHPS